MIEEQFVSFDTARMLKEAGFKANCAFILDDNQERLYRPTQALAAKWLREVYGIHVMIHPYYDCSVDADGEIVDKQMYWGYMILYAETGNLAEDNDERFDNYEQALEAGLRGVVKLIKK